MSTVLGIPLALVFLIATIVVALAMAVYAALAQAERKATIERISPLEPDRLVERLLISNQPSASTRFAEWLSEKVPTKVLSGKPGGDKLVMAGFDGAAAPILYTACSVASAVLCPVVAFVLAPKDDALWMFGLVAIGAMIGFVAPTAVLDRLVAARQTRLRRALPDALDLLVVCVEAGISLDAAILRVSRDMATLHPDLSLELAQVVRRTGAGMPRERALQGLWLRSGVDELRTLVASMVQSERLGSSIARVLRINAESLRTRRRQHAEKRAAEAALKMIFPLALFLLPALMVIIIGPAFMEIMRQMGNIGR